MQGGKRPTRSQKKLLERNGYDCNDWSYIKVQSDADGVKLIFKKKTPDDNGNYKVIKLTQDN